MIKRIPNAIGLLLGFIGVLIIFKWGPPQPNFNPYNVVITEEGPNPAVLAEKDLFSRRSRLGLIFVGGGYVLQIIALFPIMTKKIVTPTNDEN